MSEMRTEEEQVEAIKNWWKENGKSLVLSVAVVVAGVFGWRAWQANQEAEAANASALYENLSSAVESTGQLDDAALASVIHLGEQLQDEYGSTAYAPMASMLLARVHLGAGSVDAAIGALDYVINSEASVASLIELAQLRKAQLLISEGRLQDAETLINRSSDEIYAALYHELKGDLLFSQGDYAGARSAFERAMESSDPQTRSLIKMKFDDLAERG